MRCVDCELHDYAVSTHFCNYKGKSGRRRPRRVSEEDAHKDVPCEYVEGGKEQTMSNNLHRYGIMIHRKGTSYEDDYLVTDENYRTLKYIYRASANYMAEQLTKAHNGRCTFTVVRLD